MSASVIVARTRMCRTTVAIILGGKWCGDWWHRPQFVANLFSPSTSKASSSRIAAPDRLELDAPEPAGPEVAFGAAAGDGVAELVPDFEAADETAAEAGAGAETGTGAATVSVSEAAAVAGADAVLPSCPAGAVPASTNAPTPIINIPANFIR